MSASRNLPMRLICAALFAFRLSMALADDLSVVSDPESLGFSAARLARIAAWHQSRADAAEQSDPVVPGAVVAIARNGKLAYLQAIGFQNRVKTIPMRPDSIFWIASMTKPVTSVATMILVDEGKLDLDAPVAKYLPELADMAVGVERADPTTGEMAIALEPANRPMIVRDLMRHTSGLVYPPQFVHARINKLYEKAAFGADNTLAEFVASLASLPLAHQPGEVWEYSWGVDVLARVVEVASGKPFDQFLQDRIFAPLHMVDTGFYVPDDKLSRLVAAPAGRRDAPFDVTRERKLLSGGGGLVSTALDYLRFCQMLLNGGELDGARILKPETVRLMTTDSLPPGIRFVGDWIGPSAGATWGLGFEIRTDPKFSSDAPGSVGSYTWSGAWGTYFWVDPAEKLIAVQMIQASPEKAGPYFAAIRNLTYGALRIPEQRPVAPQPSPMSAAALAAYVGTYDFGPSTSARNPQVAHARLGIDKLDLVDGAPKVVRLAEGGPAAKAGLLVGDLITQFDDIPVKGARFDEAVARLKAHDASLRVKIMRDGQADPIDLTITREMIPSRAVELQVRVENGGLSVESTGQWPILEFEKGRSVPVTPLSDTEFFVDGGDHTRIAFVRDATGAVSGAVLDPGPWEQRGVRIDQGLK